VRASDPQAKKRLTRIEYERLVEKGVLGPGDRLELIAGLLLAAEPQSASHYSAVRFAEMALARTFGEGWEVRTQAPIALDDASEPEPDVAVVRGGPRDYATAHPAEPVLVLEVALTSLDFDREQKSSLYARAGQPEYWIVNLVDRMLEIRRDPERPLLRRSMGGITAARMSWVRATRRVRSPRRTLRSLSAISCRSDQPRSPP
jgi:Uma2 family endonuclease